VYRRAVALVFGELFTFARHTVTQSLLALGLVNADWSAWYRLFSKGRFRAVEAAECLLAATLSKSPADAPYVVGVDGVSIGRSSLKMPGTSWLRALNTAIFQRGLQRRQRFLHGAWLVPQANGFSRAIPLRFMAAWPAKAVPASDPPAREWEAAVAFVQWVRGQLDRWGRCDQPLLVLGDGAYENIGFWRGLPEQVVAAVRTARNRKLFTLPEPYSGRGRRRLYGPRALSPEGYLHERKGWRRLVVPVRGRQQAMRYRVEGPFLRERLSDRPVMLIVVQGQEWNVRGQRRRRAPGFWLVTAHKTATGWEPAIAIDVLLGWLWQRWELEVTHRELKSGFGVGQKQCWNRVSTSVATQWTVWVYGLLALAGYRCWGLLDGPKAPGRWWPGAQRWSWNTLWRAYRAAMWGTGEFRALWTVTPGNWPKKRDFIAGLSNAVAAAARA
jgi:hypothetical protein